jgi:hypothetical protein
VRGLRVTLLMYVHGAQLRVLSLGAQKYPEVPVQPFLEPRRMGVVDPARPAAAGRHARVRGRERGVGIWHLSSCADRTIVTCGQQRARAIVRAIRNCAAAMRASLARSKLRPGRAALRYHGKFLLPVRENFAAAKYSRQELHVHEMQLARGHATDGPQRVATSAGMVPIHHAENKVFTYTDPLNSKSRK